MASRLSTALRRRLEALAGSLKQEIQDRAPSHLKDAVSTEVHQSGEDIFIKVVVDADRSIQKYGHGDARAREFGSGLHAQIGETGFIVIKPKQAKYLVFEGTNEFEGQTIVIRRVNSPGVEAANEGEGYIRPAIQEFQDRLVPQLDPSIREEVDLTFRMAFPHAKRVKGLFNESEV